VAVFVAASALVPDSWKERMSPTPTTVLGPAQELCEALRDPSNNLFEADDWERMMDMQDWEIRRYVAERCPEQLDRFL
jgi:hypothetical protein